MDNSPVKIWRNQKYIRDLLGQTGRIVSYTIVRVPPNGFASQAPYPVVLVSLKNNRVTAQLVDYDVKQLKIGQKVQAVLRKTKCIGKEGVIPYGVKFKPV
jgi:hypothetical protein